MGHSVGTSSGLQLQYIAAPCVLGITSAFSHCWLQPYFGFLGVLVLLLNQVPHLLCISPVCIGFDTCKLNPLLRKPRQMCTGCSWPLREFKGPKHFWPVMPIICVVEVLHPETAVNLVQSEKSPNHIYWGPHIQYGALSNNCFNLLLSNTV